MYVFESYIVYISEICQCQEAVIKRPVFWAVLLILILPIMTCDVFGPPGLEDDSDGDEIIYTDVVYSPDGKSVTIYLEGSVPITKRQSRALSRELAIAGHDFFEVAFYYQSGPTRSSTDVIARASWELYRDAQIRGVYGKGGEEDTKDGAGNVTGGGVLYSYSAIYEETDEEYDSYEVIGWGNQDPPEPEYGNVRRIRKVTIPALGAGDGAAILFVGKKTDKTLLGLGKLAFVDGVSADTARIRSDTKTVTFHVAALECGVGTPNPSFLTNYHGGSVSEPTTERSVISMDGFQFDMFKLRSIKDGGSNLTSAEYWFRTNGADFDVDRLGIILAGNGSYEKKQPRYPKAGAGSGFQYFSVMMDDRTIITARNNIATQIIQEDGEPPPPPYTQVVSLGNPFVNPVEVRFDTTLTIPGSVFAFVFEVPVCPLFLNEQAGIWYIRASYDSYWLDLDDGSLRTQKGAGGAVLLSTGTHTGGSAYRIRTVIPPFKTVYPYAIGTAGPTDRLNEDINNRYFNVDGLLIVLETLKGEFVRYLSTNELNFEIGMKMITARGAKPLPGAPNPPTDPLDLWFTPGDILPQDLYGIQTVKVHYFHEDSGITHTDSFIIICDNANQQYTNIPPRNYIVIDDNIADGDIPDFINFRMSAGMAGGNANLKATFVIILNRSFDFQGQWNLQYIPPNNEPYLMIFVAGRYSASGSYNYDTQGGATYEYTRSFGRTAATLSSGVARAWGTTNAFYFGKWPFNEVLNGISAAQDYHNLGVQRRYSYQRTITDTPYGDRTLHVTFNYNINAYGPYASTATPPAGTVPQATGTGNSYFIRDGHGGRFFNVTIDPGLEIANRSWFY